MPTAAHVCSIPCPPMYLPGCFLVPLVPHVALPCSLHAMPLLFERMSGQTIPKSHHPVFDLHVQSGPTPDFLTIATFAATHLDKIAWSRIGILWLPLRPLGGWGPLCVRLTWVPASGWVCCRGIPVQQGLRFGDWHQPNLPCARGKRGSASLVGASRSMWWGHREWAPFPATRWHRAYADRCPPLPPLNNTNHPEPTRK